MQPAANNRVASPGGSHLAVNLMIRKTLRKALKGKSFHAGKNGFRIQIYVNDKGGADDKVEGGNALTQERMV